MEDEINYGQKGEANFGVFVCQLFIKDYVISGINLLGNYDNLIRP